jgi:soluble cytochrome b562
MTQEEKEEIINQAVERALLSLPEVVGNLMTQQAAFSKINSQFYKDHPEFTGHKDIVAAVVEQIDGAKPDLDYEGKLKEAVPIIKERIALKGQLNMTTASRPERNFGNGAI